MNKGLYVLLSGVSDLLDDKTRTCPLCLEEYVIGKTGVQNGCDRCEGITRNADGMIIPDPFAEVFIEEVKS